MFTIYQMPKCLKFVYQLNKLLGWFCPKSSKFFAVFLLNNGKIESINSRKIKNY